MEEKKGRPPTPETPIPKEAIARWDSLPPDTPLYIPFTKIDFDNLFLGLRGLAKAHSQLEAAVAALHRGDAETVDMSFIASHEMMIISFNLINEFIASAMSKALPQGGTIE